MKTPLKCVLIFFLSLIIICLFFFIKTPLTYSQTCGSACSAGNICTPPYTCDVNGVCTDNNSGSSTYCPSCLVVGEGYGGCEASMACPQGIQQEGNCDVLTPANTYDICCVPVSCPVQGSLYCGDTCTTDMDCMSGLTCDPLSKQCYGTLCEIPYSCPLCTGDSGFTGVCLEEVVCDGRGKNSDDGVSTCIYPQICCTNAPTGDTCNLTPISPFLVGAYFWVDLNTNSPNTLFSISSPGCFGSCLNVTTDSTGYARCSMECAPAGTYTLSTDSSSSTAKCSTTVEVLNEPGPRCEGGSGVEGWCVAIMCPSGTIPDGMGTCTIDGTACCIPEPTCAGIFGHSGECFFIQCPPDYYFEGSNPPNGDIGCPPLHSCCTQPGSEWIERNSLNPHCKTNSGVEGIKTAIGCISVTNQTELLLFVLPWAMGVAGGTAFILMIVAGYLVMTSAGDPGRAKAGKELLGAAIAGLLMIIFSVYILDVIGIKILHLPGL